MKFDKKQIQTAILESNKSIQEIAEKAGVTASVVRRAALGRPLQFITALRLAKALNLEI